MRTFAVLTALATLLANQRARAGHAEFAEALMVASLHVAKARPGACGKPSCDCGCAAGNTCVCAAPADTKKSIQVQRMYKNPDGTSRKVMESVEVVYASPESIARGPQAGQVYNYDVGGRVVQARSWEEAYKTAGVAGPVPAYPPQFFAPAYVPQFGGHRGYSMPAYANYSAGASCGAGG